MLLKVLEVKGSASVGVPPRRAMYNTIEDRDRLLDEHDNEIAEEEEEDAVEPFLGKY